MLAQYSLSQRIGYACIAALVLFATGFAGRQYLSRSPAVVLEPSAGGAVAPAPAGEAYVHVIGAVKNPGLQKLSSDARVNDAIEQAGGALPDADLNRINLAAKVQDGVQIVVPSRTPAPAGAAPTTVPVSSAPASDGEKPFSIVSLNTATLAELETLPGVGPVTAQKILQYRQERGGFKSIEDLMEVSGIGPKKMAAMRPFLSL